MRGRTQKPDAHLTTTAKTTVVSAGTSHATMWMLITLYNFINHVIRSSVPPLVAFIAQQFGYTEAQQAVLLSAFFQGYIVTQLPGGWAAQRWGGRLVSSLNLCGNALLLVLPAAARHGAGALSICLCAIGLCQGPLVPSVAVLQRAWLPPATDPLRAWIMRFISIGGRLARITAVAVTMPMALKLGWQSIAYLYGSAAAVSAGAFFALASDAPSKLPRATSSADAPSKHIKLAATKADTQVEYGIFKVPATHALIWAQVASNTADYTLSQWAPIYYSQVLGLPLAAVGAHLAVPQAIATTGVFVSAGLENALLARGVTLLAVRRLSTGVACFLEGLSLLVFGMARTAKHATAAYCVLKAAECLHSSGLSSNKLEVGGPDVGVLASVVNCCATVPAYIVPFLGVWSRKRTGSWMPLFGAAAALQFAAGAGWWMFVSITPARKLLVSRPGGPTSKR